MTGSTSFFYSGWEHIVDVNAYDHLLFVMTLCAAFTIKQWKQVLIIITAFTIGHSGTLILSSLDYIPANSNLIEMLIPFTIMVTAIDNIIVRDETSRFSSAKFKYSIALIFGLIHGLAFASNFKFMMFDENILVPLFLFNIGIEGGSSSCCSSWPRSGSTRPISRANTSSGTYSCREQASALRQPY